MDENRLTVWDPDRQATGSLDDPRIRGIYRSPDLIWRESLIPANARFIGVISRLENLLLPIHVRDAHLCIQELRLAAFLQQLRGVRANAFLLRLLELGSAHPTCFGPSKAGTDSVEVAAQYFADFQAVIHSSFNFHGKQESASWNEDVTRLEGVILRLPKLKLDPEMTWQRLREEFDAPNTVWYTDTRVLDCIPVSGMVLRCGLPEIPSWKSLAPRLTSHGTIQTIQVNRDLTSKFR